MRTKQPESVLLFYQQHSALQRDDVTAHPQEIQAARTFRTRPMNFVLTGEVRSFRRGCGKPSRDIEHVKPDVRRSRHAEA